MAKSGTNLDPVDLSSYLADQVLADIPPQYRHPMAKSGTNLGLVDLSSYLADKLLAHLTPHRGILWPRVEITWVWLT